MPCLAFVAMVASVALGPPPEAFARADRACQRVERVSVAPDGSAGNADSVPGSGIGISADGRFVSFSSKATNLVGLDTNGAANAFVYDRLRRTTEIVSVDDAGRPATADFPSSTYPVISGNGRYVAFVSATKLSPDTPDTLPFNAGPPLYVRDREKHETRFIAVPETRSEIQPTSFSYDGRMLAYLDTGHVNLGAIFDQATGDTIGIGDSVVLGSVGSLQIASDGRHLAYSAAGNAVSFCPGLVLPSGFSRVFEADLRAPTSCTRISLAPDGSEAGGAQAAISSNGRYVAFARNASLVPGSTSASGIFVRDTVQETTEPVSVAGDGTPSNGGVEPSISGNGRYVAFTGGSVASPGAFVHDRFTGATAFIAASSGRAVLSEDGRFVELGGSRLLPDDPPGVLQTYVWGPVRSLRNCTR